MFVLLITSFATVLLTLATASMAMNATMWLVVQTKGLGLGARGLAEADALADVVLATAAAPRSIACGWRPRSGNRTRTRGSHKDTHTKNFDGWPGPSGLK